jgi:hypothetical protein
MRIPKWVYFFPNQFGISIASKHLCSDASGVIVRNLTFEVLIPGKRLFICIFEN